MRRLFGVFLLLIVWALVALGALQQETGTIRGRVGDAIGAPVIGAQISISHATQNVSKQTTVDDQGRFVFEDLPVGKYTVRAEGNGTSETVECEVEAGREAFVQIQLRQ